MTHSFSLIFARARDCARIYYALAGAASITGGRPNARVIVVCVDAPVVPVRVLPPLFAACTAWRGSSLL